MAETHVHADRALWAPGPWSDEPDREHWVDPATGLDCLCVRGPFGSWCGYVGLPADHALHGSDTDEKVTIPGDAANLPVNGAAIIPAFIAAFKYDQGSPSETYLNAALDCHGGINFAAPSNGRSIGRTFGVEDDLWWLGFDCGHYRDGQPLKADPGPFDNWMQGTYRNLRYVRSEVSRLAAQLSGTKIRKAAANG